MMRGIMIVGIKAPIGFVLHAQDIEPFPATTGPPSERALQSFALEVGAAEQ